MVARSFTRLMKIKKHSHNITHDRYIALNNEKRKPTLQVSTSYKPYPIYLLMWKPTSVVADIPVPLLVAD